MQNTPTPLKLTLALIAALALAACTPSPGTTNEVIMLKGVPFDTPGQRDAVINLCLTENPIRAEKLKASDYWCKIDDRQGRISMPEFEYGNLPDRVSHALVLPDGTLIEFETSASKGGILELAALLKERYGPAKVENSQIENKLGNKFDKQTFTWVDKRGTRITLESLYDRVDSGRVLIESASRIKMNDEIEQTRKNSAKGNL